MAYRWFPFEFAMVTGSGCLGNCAREEGFFAQFLVVRGRGLASDAGARFPHRARACGCYGRRGGPLATIAKQAESRVPAARRPNLPGAGTPSQSPSHTPSSSVTAHNKEFATDFRAGACERTHHVAALVLRLLC